MCTERIFFHRGPLTLEPDKNPCVLISAVTEYFNSVNLHLFVCIGDLLSCMSLYMCMYSAHGGHKRTLNPQKLQLQTGLSPDVGAGNWSWVLWKYSQWLNPQAIFSPTPPSVNVKFKTLWIWKSLGFFFNFWSSLFSTSNHKLSFPPRSVMPSRCQKVKKILTPDFVK